MHSTMSIKSSHIVCALAMLVILLPQMKLGDCNSCPADTTSQGVWGSSHGLNFTISTEGLTNITGKAGAVIDQLIFMNGDRSTVYAGGEGRDSEYIIEIDSDDTIIGIKGVHVAFCGRGFSTLSIQTKNKGWLGPIGGDEQFSGYWIDPVEFYYSRPDGFITEIYGTDDTQINSIGITSRLHSQTSKM